MAAKTVRVDAVIRELQARSNRFAQKTLQVENSSNSAGYHYWDGRSQEARLCIATVRRLASRKKGKARRG